MYEIFFPSFWKILSQTDKKNLLIFELLTLEKNIVLCSKKYYLFLEKKIIFLEDLFMFREKYYFLL